MIHVKSVRKSYGNHVVLDNINLSFEAEKTHVLLGLSGCGKTTLLRLIQGLDQADSGEVVVADINVNLKSQRLLSQKLGYVIQKGGLFPHFTAKENVCLMARELGWSESKINSRIEELTELVQIDIKLLQKFPSQLSGGQKQRIGLMRALMLDPQLLLLDEPLGSLDPIVRADLQFELKRIFNTLNKTVIVVTHDITEAAFFGHTITILNRGKVEQTGEFEQFIKNPASPFVSKFMRSQRSLLEVVDFDV